MNKKELPVLSVILYAVGGLTAIFSVAIAFEIAADLLESINSGAISLTESLFDIVYYMASSSGVYLIYTLLLVGVGRALQYCATATRPSDLD